MTRPRNVRVPEPFQPDKRGNCKGCGKLVTTDSPPAWNECRCPRQCQRPGGCGHYMCQ